MFDSLKKSVVQKLAWSFPLTRCPNCGAEFRPYESSQLRNFSDLKNCLCPKCGNAITPARSAASVPIIPEERYERPPVSKIDRSPLGPQEWLYYIPRTDKGGFLLVFAIIWNVIVWPIAFAIISSSLHDMAKLQKPTLFVLLFPVIGLGLVYTAVRQMFSIHILYLGREKIRLERELFGRKKTQDLAMREVAGVSLEVFYTQNHQPVHGIQITGANSKIKFGSALSPEEKTWLTTEISSHLDEVQPGARTSA